VEKAAARPRTLDGLAGLPEPERRLRLGLVGGETEFLRFRFETMFETLLAGRGPRAARGPRVNWPDDERDTEAFTPPTD